MTNRIPTLSLSATARIAGVLYLTIILSGIFAQFYVRNGLITPGDASATAESILASEGLFRSGIAADLIMILADVTLALVFYVLLKPVSHALALLAAFLRLAQAAVLGVNLLNLFIALQLISGVDYLAVAGEDLLNAQALLFLNAHAIGYTVGLTFFGLSILVLGYLVIKSGYIPKILGAGLLIAAVGYLVDSFAQTLLPNYADYADIFGLVVFAPAVIAELALCLWLLIKGVRTEGVQRRTGYPNAAEVDFA